MRHGLYAPTGLSFPMTQRRPAAARGIPPQSEASFQARVIQYATLMGWKTYHPFDSRRSTSGWPDLALCRVQRGYGRLVLAELKSASGVVSAAQQEWLDDLGKCPGTEVFCWRPADWSAIKEVLA